MSSPITTLVNLYSTLNMEFDIVAADTLYNHTRITKDPMLGVHKSKYYSTYRTADNDIYKWKTQLRLEQIRHVEENCVEFMQKVGFNISGRGANFNTCNGKVTNELNQGNSTPQ